MFLPGILNTHALSRVIMFLLEILFMKGAKRRAREPKTPLGGFARKKNSYLTN